MQFAKHALFTLNGKTYKVLSNHVHDKRLPASPRKGEDWNAVELIEVVKEKELDEYIWREVVPVSIASQVKRELTNDEKVHDEYVMFGSKVYSKQFLYSLIEQNKLKII